MPARNASRGEPAGNSASLKTIAPASGRTMPKRIFISVLLPDPFSPSRPTIDPASTVRSMPTLARRGPYDLVIPRISSRADMLCSGFRRSVRAQSGRSCHGSSDAAARVVLRDGDLQFAARELGFHGFDGRGDVCLHRWAERLA